MNYILLIIFITIGGLLSINFGSPLLEWDVLNYHLYAPHALLTGRIGFDVLPCGIRSYFNPTLDIPFYLMVKYLNNHPFIVTFIQGSYYGVLLFACYKISELVFVKNSAEKQLFSIFSAIMTGTAAMILYEIGTLYNDLQVAILILIAAYILLKYLFDKDSKKRSALIFLAGIILGTVFGLKLTSAFMIFGLFAASLVLVKKIDTPLKIFGYCALGALTGFVITSGFWYYLIYEKFNNPFFPFYNNIFKSFMGSFNAIIDSSYAHSLPKNLAEKIFYPFMFLIQKPTEGFGARIISYVDWRYLVICLATLYLSAKLYIKRKTKNNNFDNRKILFLIVFLLSSYIIWLNVFSIVRYAIALIVIGCILINILIYDFSTELNNRFPKIKTIYYYILLFIIFQFSIQSNTKINVYEIRQKIGNQVLTVEKMNFEDDSLVLLASQKASIVLLNQNPKARYAYLMVPKAIPLKPTAFLYNNRNIDYYHSFYFQDKTEKLIKESKNIYLIYLQKEYNIESELYKKSLTYYLGKEPKIENCRTIHTKQIPEEGNYYKVCKIIKNY